MTYLVQQSIFVLRTRYIAKIKSFFRKIPLTIQGMKIGKRVYILNMYVTWPHQVFIGDDCKLEPGINFKYDGIWKTGPSINIGHKVFIGYSCEFNIRKGIIIGDNSLIASGCKFIDHDHGIALNELMNKQAGIEKEIIIENDVWIGCNCIILKGVVIAQGSIVAAGAVVTKSIPPYEIWGGVPAKKIGERN
jgi:acetyltransferase-like isoleucine patch superfamily enzyme